MQCERKVYPLKHTEEEKRFRNPTKHTNKTRHDLVDLLSDKRVRLNRGTTRPQTSETQTKAPNILGHDMILHQNATYKVPQPNPPKSHVIP